MAGDARLSPYFEVINGSRNEWTHPDIPSGRYRLIGHDGKTWQYVDEQVIERSTGALGKTLLYVDAQYREVELILDRR